MRMHVLRLMAQEMSCLDRTGLRKPREIRSSRWESNSGGSRESLSKSQRRVPGRRHHACIVLGRPLHLLRQPVRQSVLRVLHVPCRLVCDAGERGAYACQPGAPREPGRCPVFRFFHLLVCCRPGVVTPPLPATGLPCSTVTLSMNVMSPCQILVAASLPIGFEPLMHRLAYVGFGLFVVLYATLGFVCARRRKCTCRGRTCYTPRETEGWLLPLVGDNCARLGGGCSRRGFVLTNSTGCCPFNAPQKLVCAPIASIGSLAFIILVSAPVGWGSETLGGHYWTIALILTMVLQVRNADRAVCSASTLPMNAAPTVCLSLVVCTARCACGGDGCGGSCS